MYIGIICEFDPLHSGHARLLSHARAMGPHFFIWYIFRLDYPMVPMAMGRYTSKLHRH